MLKLVVILAIAGLTMGVDLGQFCKMDPTHQQAEVNKLQANLNGLPQATKQALQKCAAQAFHITPQDKTLPVLVGKICHGNAAQYQKCVHTSLPITPNDRKSEAILSGGAVVVLIILCIVFCFG